MWRDSIVDEVDLIRRTLLAECGDDLNALFQRFVEENRARTERVESVEDLNSRFPCAPVDAEAVAALGEPWRDPIVEEVRRVREQISLSGVRKDPPKAKSA